MYCPYCGKEHLKGARFCPTTGKTLPKSKSALSNVWLTGMIIAAILGLIALISAILPGRGSDTESGPADGAGVPFSTTQATAPATERSLSPTLTRASAQTPARTPTKIPTRTPTRTPAPIVYDCSWVLENYSSIMITSLAGFNLIQNTEVFDNDNLPGYPDTRSIVLTRGSTELHNAIYCFNSASLSLAAFKNNFPLSGESVPVYDYLGDIEIDNKRYDGNDKANVVIVYHNILVVVKYDGTSASSNAASFASQIAANLIRLLPED